MHTHASPRAAIGFLIHAAGLARDALGAARQSLHAGRLLHGGRADRRAAPHRRRASRRAHPPRSTIRWWRASSTAGRSASRRAARASSASRPRARSTRSSASISTRTAAARSSPERRHATRRSGNGTHASLATQRNGQCIDLGRQSSPLGRDQGAQHENTTQALRRRGRHRRRDVLDRRDARNCAPKEALRPASRVGATDLGGVVDRAERAGSRRLGDRGDDRPADQVREDRGDRRSRPLRDSRAAEGELQACGCAATGSSIRPRSRPRARKHPQPEGGAAPNAAAAAEYYPAIYWYSMLKIPEKSEFPGTGARRQRHGRALESQAEWLNIVKTNGCMTCHAAGQPRRRARSRRSSRTFKTRTRRGRGASSPARRMTQHDQRHRPARRRSARSSCSPTGPTASPPASCRSHSRRGRKASSATSCSRCGTGARPTAYLHDVISTDQRKPTVNANGKLYGATEESTDFVPVLDPMTHTATRVMHPVRDPKTPSSKDEPDGALAVLGRRADLGQPDQHAQSDDGREGPGLVHRARAPAGRIRPSARRARTIRRRRLFPIERANRHLSMYDPKTGKFTLISTCFPTHHLIFAEDANNTLWTERRRPATGSIGWLNRKMFEETGDEAAVARLDAVHPRHQRQRQARRLCRARTSRSIRRRTSASSRASTASASTRSTARSGARRSAVPGLHRARRSRARIRRDTALTEIYELPLDRRLRRRAAGTSTATASSGRRLRAATSASFDRRKCKGPLNGPNATGKHCPEGWTLYPFPGPQFRDVKDAGQRRGELLHLGRPVRHVRARQERADRHRQPQRRAARARRRQVRHAARALPDGLLRQVGGRAHRRSQRRLERQGPVGDLGNRTPFHMEGGKGTRPKVVGRFQLRPDPLAR